MLHVATMECLPQYNDKIKPIYSIILTNIITLGGCSTISLFGLDDIILCLLFWFQITAANNNQGFLNKIYDFRWRVIDVMGALTITLYMLVYYKNAIPDIIFYPYSVILGITAYSQSTSKSMKDYILLVNIWHLLLLFLLIMMIFFKYPDSFTNGDIILTKDVSYEHSIVTP